MKSIQSKITVLMIIGIVFSSTLIGGVGVWSFRNVINKDSARIMNLICEENAQELNNLLGRIEQSVEIMSVYAVDNLGSIDQLSHDSDYLDQYTKNLEELGLTTANKTDGSVAVYVRFNPDITTSTAGYFKVKNTKTGQFEDCELTDFSKYSPDDVGHLGWYYIPVKAGKAVWLQPYYNKNIDIYMISYVIPIYKRGTLIGIVGMDIDFRYITEKTDHIQLYDTGYAFLADQDFTIIHSKNVQNDRKARKSKVKFLDNGKNIDTGTLYEYTSGGVKKKVTFQSISNDMVLGVAAPVSEINRNRNQLIFKILFIELIVALMFVLVAGVISRTIVRPIKELNVAAQAIAGGNLDISIACQSKDEVGELSESLKETAHQLKMRIDYINNLAYVDKLTGTKNNTAYLHRTALLKENLQKKDTAFAVFVIDVNGLKRINDTYGHECGNQLIIAVSEVIGEVFGQENVYRIGGDEFAAVLDDVNQERCCELKQIFSETIKKKEGNILLSAAIGSAVFEKNTDNGYESVFQRADEEMYKMKQEMKAEGETSKIAQENC